MKKKETNGYLCIEEKDKLILNTLIENSRLSLRNIASKTKMSTATVMHRLQALERGKVVRGYTAKVNYQALGYDMEVVIEIRVSRGKLMEVERKIAADHNVFAVYDITGPFDALILARFKSRRNLDAFVKRLQSFEFVERTETKLVLNTIKDEHGMRIA